MLAQLCQKPTPESPAREVRLSNGIQLACQKLPPKELPTGSWVVSALRAAAIREVQSLAISFRRLVSRLGISCLTVFQTISVLMSK